MNLQQIRFVCEIVDHGLNISRAAEALDIAQSAISRQMQLLEKELGATIFVRSRKRIISLSRPGEAILKVARRMLQEADNLRKIGADYDVPNQGDLTVATNHTYARYVLSSVIERYGQLFPGVRVSLYQGNPNEIGNWLTSGIADISISTKPTFPHNSLAFLPLETLPRVVVVPTRHKLLRIKEIMLGDLAQYPIIAFQPAFPGGENIMRAFRVNSLTPRFIVKAANADVVKAYVRRGLGIGIISKLGFSPSEDRDLRTIDVNHLFPSHQIHIGLRKGCYMQTYVLEFLKLVAPNVPRELLLKKKHNKIVRENRYHWTRAG